MQALTQYTKKLKEMFLPELLNDEGWSKEIDLYLTNLDVSYLHFLSAKGFPYRLYLSELPTDSVLFEVTRSGDSVKVIYPKTNGPLVDFGEVEVVPVNLEAFQPDGVVGSLPYYTIDGQSHWSAVYLQSEVDAGNLPYLELRSLPDELNPSFIADYKKANFQTFDDNAPPTSPSSLFKAIADLGRFRFFVSFEGLTGVSERVRSFSDYITFYNVRSNALPEPWLSMSTASKCLIDALRDKFGYGVTGSQILGYDKQYLVTLDNAPTAKTKLLAANVEQGEDILITSDKSDIEFAQHGSGSFIGIPLDTPSATATYEALGNHQYSVTVTISAEVAGAASYQVGFQQQDGTILWGDSFTGLTTTVTVESEGEEVIFVRALPESGDPVSEDSLPLSIPLDLMDKSLDSPVLDVRETSTGGTNYDVAISWGAVPNATSYHLAITLPDSTIFEYDTSDTSYTYAATQEGVYVINLQARADGYTPGDAYHVCLTLHTVEKQSLASPTITWQYGLADSSKPGFPYVWYKVSNVDNAQSLQARIDSGDWVTVSADTWVDGFTVTEPGVHVIYAQAIADPASTQYSDSQLTHDQVNVERLAAPAVTSVVDNTSRTVTFSWNAVANATGYSYFVQEAQFTGSTSGTTVTLYESQIGTSGTFRLHAVTTGNYLSSLYSYSNFSLTPEVMQLSKSSVNYDQRSDEDTLTVTDGAGFDIKLPEVTDTQGAVGTFAAPMAFADELLLVDESGRPETYVEDTVTIHTDPGTEFTIHRNEATEPVMVLSALAAWVETSPGVFEKYLLGSPESIRSTTSYGIIKYYYDLALISSPIRSVDVYIESLQSVFMGEYGQATIDAIRDILSHAVPAGCGYSINFVYPQVSSDITLTDDLVVNVEQIRIDGQGTSATVERVFEQRGGSTTINVTTAPRDFSFDVTT